MTKRTSWRYVRSNKPQREGEIFIMHDDTFVMKIYKDQGGVELARKLVAFFKNQEPASQDKASCDA